MNNEITKPASKFIFGDKHQLFLNFIEHTDQAKNAVDYIKTLIPDILSKRSENNNIIKYLDIGCGYGYKTSLIIEAFKEGNNIINTVALDPSSELLEIFKQQIVVNKDINLVCSTWEDYHLTTKFDFISSIHTFYYMDNWKIAIRKMLENLNSGGVICLVLRTDNEICQFKDYFFKKIDGAFKKEPNFNDLCNIANLMGLQYKTTIIKSRLDIRDCILNSEQGKQLIEFLLRLPYHNIPNSIQKEIREYLEKNQHNGYLNSEDGFMLIST